MEKNKLTTEHKTQKTKKHALRKGLFENLRTYLSHHHDLFLENLPETSIVYTPNELQPKFVKVYHLPRNWPHLHHIPFQIVRTFYRWNQNNYPLVKR